MANKPIILYGVLNWGLGHATRSIPIIQRLGEHGFEVVICSDGLALDFLKKEFPGSTFEKLRGYNVRYQKGMGQLWGLLWQLPKVYRAIQSERAAVKSLAKKHGATAVISDNRLGFHHPKLPSVYITHQLKIMMPLNTQIGSKLHHWFMCKFDVCWVPDFEGEGISGEIGHGVQPPIPVEYIGPCSRFLKPLAEVKVKKYGLAAILSGPEPQRTLLEKKLLHEMSKMAYRCLLIRGTQARLQEEVAENIEVKDMVGAKEIEAAIAESEITISRSGYSSLMDYYVLKNRALLIPTPGQPEQEYLARFQLHKGRFAYVGQDYINLKEDLIKAGFYNGFGTIENEKKVDWHRIFSVLKESQKITRNA